SVHGAGEVESSLDLPYLLVLARREDPSRVAHCNPTDRHECLVGQHGVDVDDTVDANLDFAPQPRTGEQRATGRQEAARANRCSIDVSVRADQHVVAEPGWVFGPAAHQGVLHDYAAIADIY